MVNQRKLEVLNGLERDLETLYTEVNAEGVKPIRLKEIKEEVIEYAELMDVTLYPNITEEEKKVLYKKDKVEQKLSKGYLKNRLPEVIKDLLDNVKKAVVQEQITIINKGEETRIESNLIKFERNEGSVNLLSNFKTEDIYIAEVKLIKGIGKHSTVSINKDKDSDVTIVNIDNIGNQEWYVKNFDIYTPEGYADLILTSNPLHWNSKDLYVSEIKTIEKENVNPMILENLRDRRLSKPVYQVKFKPNRHCDITYEVDIVIACLEIEKNLETGEEILTICSLDIY